MDERISRVLEKMKEKGIDQLLVSDPLSIRFLTGIMVNPGERLYALLLRTSGKHTLFLNYLYYVSNTGFEEIARCLSYRSDKGKGLNEGYFFAM